jgi:hypothetical protein
MEEKQRSSHDHCQAQDRAKPSDWLCMHDYSSVIIAHEVNRPTAYPHALTTSKLYPKYPSENDLGVSFLLRCRRKKNPSQNVD